MSNNYKFNLFLTLAGVSTIIVGGSMWLLYSFILQSPALVAVFVVLLVIVLSIVAFLFFAIARNQSIVPTALKQEPYTVTAPAQLPAPRDTFMPFVAQPRRARANTVTFRLSDGSDVTIATDVVQAFCDLTAPSRAQWRDHVGGGNDDLAALRRVGMDRGYIVAGAWADAGAGARMSREVTQWQN